MKALRLLLTYLGMFAFVLGGVLLVDRLSRPAIRPWHDLVPGLPAGAATVAPGRSAERAGLRLQVVKTEVLAARDLAGVRLSSRAQAQPGQAFLLVTLSLTNTQSEPATFRTVGPRPTDTFLLGVTRPRQVALPPVLPGDVARLGAAPLGNVTLPPGDAVQGAVGFIVDGSEQRLSLLVVPVSASEGFGTLELLVD